MKNQTRSVICEALETAYPREGCGILFGREETVRRPDEDPESVYTVPVEKAYPVRNRVGGFEGGKHFRVDPMELYRIEREAEAEGLSVIGFYHSHPEHAAVLSEEDREYMIPGMLYLVVSLHNGRCLDWRCYRKD